MERTSAIHGEGYGSSHVWERLGSAQVGSGAPRCTFYRCVKCSRFFPHYYDWAPDIFAAIRGEGIPDVCAAAARASRPPWPEHTRALLEGYVLGGSAGPALQPELIHTSFRHIISFLGEGGLELERACADVGVTLEQLVAWRGAGMSPKAVASAILGRGGQGSQDRQ